MSDDTPSHSSNDEKESSSSSRPGGPSFHPPDGSVGTPSEGAGPSPTAPPRPARRWRRRTPVVIGGGVLAIALVVVVVVAVTGGSDEVGGKVAAARRPDPVPTGPIVRNIPFDCGVRIATVDWLAPGAERRGTSDTEREECTWERGRVASSSGGGNRELSVEVRMATRDEHSSPLSETVDTYSRLVAKVTESRTETKVDSVKTLTGLGDEAVLVHHLDSNGPIFSGDRQPKVYSHTAYSTIVFRVGNIATTITYGGADYRRKESAPLTRKPKEKTLSTRTTNDGAIAVAMDVAASLQVPVHTTPTATQPPSPPATRKLPVACDLVSDATVRRLTERAKPRRDESLLFDRDDETVESDRCEWDGLGPHLEVDVARVKGSPPTGGRAKAIRTYLERHADNRDAPPSEKDAEKAFSALRGPGERAFVVYEKDDTSIAAEVIFQVRDLLVKVRYWSLDSAAGAPSKDEAMNGAYAVARKVAKALSG